MSMLVSIFAAASVLAGAFFFIAGTLGLLRFGDTLSRVHALTKADNLGLGLIVLGLLPLADSLADALKLLVIWALVLLGGTTAAQLVAGAVRREQEPPS
ncbi:MAG: monovalent cation/H(+) antiporter subunit G [Roseomonas sp.]|nr:monovalent cation/H(+) antiporter subunit G [Roseomonas sp.]MCA3431145.1 monovalent cation/H(+) antiporter subunit G [Roseomonas sp.]MCA3434675.1 monovalent cation/H(+) antiporter subunit G [Roseomonas sp.]